jgi:hypothetical protein
MVSQFERRLTIPLRELAADTAGVGAGDSGETRHYGEQIEDQEVPNSHLLLLYN